MTEQKSNSHGQKNRVDPGKGALFAPDILIVSPELHQVKFCLYNAISMEIVELEKKLDALRLRLKHLEEVEAEKIRVKRIAADMDDDYRENEGAKLVMEDHNLWFMRKIGLMKEILDVKKTIFKLKNVK